MWKLTGNYYLRKRFLGGYNVYVEFLDTTSVDTKLWRRALPKEVAQVISKVI
jgi:hypothetical protein